ncbi:hypothetical protein BV25DRAFT_1823393 [Artomyces pyxidatus]|uniref:Uncharacterized protein n=1 Tax=Artomyces pyxidatus TaxID=48021 RepID=A0ACB8T6K6_9AGAM|nr:hypothetical protein BV25DRAFT_1823393 [Artomyces pyxidatus]
MATATPVGSNPTLLATLRAAPASWARELGFAPGVAGQPASDIHIQERYTALLALHAAPPDPADEALVAFLLDEETRYHQAADHYRSALSLAALLAARYRTPAHLWAIWAARESSHDASVCVDSHLMYYAAGGMEAAAAYVKQCTKADILGGAKEGSARISWWRWFVEEHADDEDAAAEAVKKQVLDRIVHDEKYGVTEEKVVGFVESSWRTDTERWGQSLLPEEYP